MTDQERIRTLESLLLKLWGKVSELGLLDSIYAPLFRSMDRALRREGILPMTAEAKRDIEAGVWE